MAEHIIKIGEHADEGGKLKNNDLAEKMASSLMQNFNQTNKVRGSSNYKNKVATAEQKLQNFFKKGVPRKEVKITMDNKKLQKIEVGEGNNMEAIASDAIKEGNVDAIIAKLETIRLKMEQKEELENMRNKLDETEETLAQRQ